MHLVEAVEGPLHLRTILEVSSKQQHPPSSISELSAEQLLRLPPQLLTPSAAVVRVVCCVVMAVAAITVVIAAGAARLKAMVKTQVVQVIATMQSIVDSQSDSDEKRSTSSASAPAPPPYTHRQRLVKFYLEYNPAKLQSVEEMLVKRAGNEDTLFKALDAGAQVRAR
jgi:hypothetical protein